MSAPAQTRSPAGSASLKEAAEKVFAERRWPLPSDEAWRRTDVRSYDFDGMLPYTGPMRVDDTAPPQGVAVAFRDSSVQVGPSISGAVVAPFGIGLPLDAAVEGVFAATAVRALGVGTDRFPAWVLSAPTHGVVVQVESAQITEPIVIDFTFEGGEAPLLPLVVLDVAEGSEAEIVIRLVVDGERIVVPLWIAAAGANAGVAVTQVHVVGDDSSVFANTVLLAERDSRVRHRAANFGGLVSTSDVRAELNGAGADVKLDGLYLAGADHHIDARSVQAHHAEHTVSRATYKGAVDGEARSIYQGLIEVDPAARGTDAYLTNRNLILSDSARADSIPSLRINTNDVRCSHGSTTGKIDPAQLFYLGTRGYDGAEARRVILEGFFEEVIGDAPGEIADDLRRRIRSGIGEEEPWHDG